MRNVFVLDDTGGHFEWRVARNCVWRTAFELTDEDGHPEDITAATITAAITANQASTTALKTFTVTKTAATRGEWSIHVADSAADLSPGTYWWAMELDDGTGDEPMASGPFIVEPWSV